MDTVYSQLRADEIEINFVSILKQCAKKIRFILLVAIVAALLLPAMKYALDYKNYTNSLENSELEPQVDLEKIEAELSLLEKNSINKYQMLKTKLDKLETYQKESYIMSMDDEKVYSVALQFWFDSQVVEPDRVAQLYINFVQNGGLAQAVEKLDTSVSADDVYDLIWNYSTESQYEGIMELMVISSTKEESEHLAELTNIALEEYCMEQKSNVGEHSISCIQTVESYGYMERVYAVQLQNYEDYSYISGLIRTMEQDFTENQKLLLYSDEVDSDVSNSAEKPTINVLFIFIGFVVGIFVATAIIAVFAIFNRKVHSDMEINKRLGYKYLQTVYYNPDTLINRICLKNRQSGSVYLSNAIRKIIARLKDVDVSDIAILGVCDSRAKLYINEIIDQLSKDGIHAEVLGDVVNSITEYERLRKYKHVIYISEINMQKVSTLYLEHSICAETEVNVLGYVMISE